MSDTPRTDAELTRVTFRRPDEVIAADLGGLIGLCRQLERELAEAKRLYEEALEHLA